MTGSAVLWLGGRLLHTETVALIVAPAVGDLQHELSAPTLVTRTRGYVAIWVAFGGALWYDLVWAPRGPAWHAPLATAATSVFVVTAYHVALVMLLLNFNGPLRLPAGTTLARYLFSGWALAAASVALLAAALAQRARARALTDQWLCSTTDGAGAPSDV